MLKRAAVAATVVLAAAGCTSTGSAGPVTVTSNVTAAGATAAAGSPGSASVPLSAPAPGSTTSPGSTGAGSASAGPVAARHPLTSGPVPAGTTVEPDGFQIRKLAPGQEAPQFIVFSFDGVGWDEKWQYWFGVAAKVPLHFTGFLSGTYMLTKQTAARYTGPGHKAGHASIPFGTAADLPVEIGNLNKALSLGDEIGTHFNGHFCDDNTPGGNQWNTADWNNELDQFFALVENVDTNNGMTDKLNLPAGEIKGERTPCLTGHKADLYPALEAHGMDYDSSFTRTGLSWPTKSTDGKIWQLGMSEFPTHGTGHPQITMDYNYYAQQEPHVISGGGSATPAQSAADSQQVLDTYGDMYQSAMTDGIHEPLILGNHFNDWNNNAYSNAIGNFALQYCGKANTYCVPFRDLVDWTNAQDPSVIAALQNHKSNLGGCPYLAWPKCDGKIKY